MDAFAKKDVKRIWTEVKIKNFRYKQTSHQHPIEWIYYKPDGSVLGKMQSTFNVKKEWRNTWMQRGWGWKTKGNWKKGRYRVRILMDGQQVAEESYRIY